MNIEFLSNQHKEKYSKLINELGEVDRNTKVLLYITASGCTINTNDCYSIKQKELILENIEKYLDFASNGEIILLKLALHFFNPNFYKVDMQIANLLDTLDTRGNLLLKNSILIYRELAK